MITEPIKGLIVESLGRKCRVLVDIDLVYDKDGDPYAVAVVFKGVPADDGPKKVTWYVGRDLLKFGTVSPMFHGEGDVQVRVDGTGGYRLLAKFASGSGQHATVAFARSQVTRFLDRTYEEVPLGEEDMGTQVDAALKGILG